MKIAVSGASGNVGRLVLAELGQRAPSASIVAISRTPENHAQIEARFSDYDQPESLLAAYRGIDRLLIIPGPDLRPGIRARQLVAAVDAAKAAGVGHVFLLSATGTMAEEEPAIGAAYWTSEQYLIKSGIPAWTLLRMSYFSETLAEEAQMSLAHGAMPGLAENRISFVARTDVAAAAAAALAGEGHVGAICNLTGPQAVSAAERAAAISQAAGRDYGYLTLPEEAMRGGLAQMNLPDFIVDAIISMKARQARGAYDIVSGDIERLTGRAPKPLSEVLGPLLGPKAA